MSQLLMSDQIVLLSEPCIAFLAHVLPLACMCDQMHYEMLFLYEGLIAEVTSESPVIRVLEFMSGQIDALVERLAAEATMVRTLVRVGDSVSIQMPDSLKGLMTVRTLVPPQSNVRRQMFGQITLLGERFLAQITLKRTYIGVGLPMLTQLLL